MNIQLIHQTRLSTIFFENELRQINDYSLYICGIRMTWKAYCVMYIYTYIIIWTYVHTYVYLHMYMFVYTYIRTYVPKHTCMNIGVLQYVRTYVCTHCTYLQIHMYVQYLHSSLNRCSCMNIYRYVLTYVRVLIFC